MSAAAMAQTIPEDYELVAQNDALALYLHRDSMAIAVMDMRTGHLMHSAVQNPNEMPDNKTWKGFYQSGLVVEYIEDVNPVPIQADFINNAHTLEYTLTGNGFDALVTFTDIGISLRVQVLLDEKGLHVTVPQSSIVEAKATPESKKDVAYHLCSVQLFPFLGHTYLGQDAGYMIIPDGQGAIITLQDNEKRFKTAFEAPVYGAHTGQIINTYYEWYVPPESIRMPIFGMVHTEKEMAFLGVIEEGDASAYIRAYPNGVITSFDWIGARFVYREIYSQPTVNSRAGEAGSSSLNMLTPAQRSFDIRLHFFFTSGDEANYAGLAACYGRFLESKGAFAAAQSAEGFRMNVEFMGAEAENDLFGKHEVVMTTFEEAEEILRDLHDQGVERLCASFIGWQKGGVTGGLPVTGYSPSGELGGVKALENLLAYCNDREVELSLSADFLTLNLEANPLMRYEVFKKITGEAWQTPTFKKVYATLYHLRPGMSAELAKRTTQQLKDANYRAITFTGFPGLVTDYKEEDDYRDSVTLMKHYSAVCADASSKLHVRLAAANAYLWRYAAALTDIPMSSSGYLYTSYDIPFLSIVLSGRIPFYAEYTNFQANNRQFFLSLIEQGAFPSFLITSADPIDLINTNSNEVFSSQYELYREMMVGWYHELSAAFEAFGDASIIAHERAGDMVCVTRDNGVRVFLNFGDHAATMDGVTLEGLTYKVVK